MGDEVVVHGSCIYWKVGVATCGWGGSSVLVFSIYHIIKAATTSSLPKKKKTKSPRGPLPLPTLCQHKELMGIVISNLLKFNIWLNFMKILFDLAHEWWMFLYMGFFNWKLAIATCGQEVLHSCLFLMFIVSTKIRQLCHFWRLRWGPLSFPTYMVLGDNNMSDNLKLPNLKNLEIY